ncbi:hypothetical protein D9M72_117240 [compost metagenome]
MPRDEAPRTPTVSSSSSSTARTPRCARSQASVRPEGPAPTITTGWRTTVVPFSSGGGVKGQTGNS